MTDFVGREAELDQLRALVATRRLITVTGEAGVGKSRTAARLAEMLRRSFGESTGRIVVGDATGTRLIDVIASGLEASGATLAGLARSFGDRPFLLILDEVDNPRGAATVIEEILESTTETRIVVTSRARTGIRGETPYVLGPLALPSRNALGETPASALGTDTGILLIHRIADTYPDFNAADVASADILAVCQSTDGLPRYIEAAARAVSALGLQETAAAVTEDPTVLEAFIPQTRSRPAPVETSMRATLAGLSPAATTLARGLALLEAGCDLRFAADLFYSGSLATLAAPIAELVEHSLVRSETVDGERRVRVPLHYRKRLLRDWSSEDRSSEQQRVHQAMIDRLRHCAAAWFSDEQLSAVQFLNRHAADVTALISGMAANPQTAHDALKIITALRYYWQLHPVDPWPRARDWLGSALSLDQARDDVTLRAMQTDAYIAYYEGDLDGARSQLRAIDADLAAGIAGSSEQLFSIFIAALVDVAEGRVEEAEPHLAAALRAALESEVRDHVGEKYWHLAACQIVLQKEDAAEFTVADGVAYCDRTGDRWGRAYMSCLLALLEVRRGQSTQAVARLRAALDVMTRFGDRAGLGLCLQLLASILEHTDEDAGMTELVSLVPAGTVQPPAPSGEGRWLSSPASLPDSRQFGEVLRRLTEAKHASSTPPERSDVQHVLSARETEVAALIAEGLANPAIAARLVLSRRTVEGHVQRILAKLGFRSRSQIAVWVTQNLDLTEAKH